MSSGGAKRSNSTKVSSRWPPELMITKPLPMKMSKDINTPNPSFRVYYGGASVAVPFTWESAPGTPKHDLFSDDYYASAKSNRPLPLSPPPSFYSAAASGARGSYSSRSSSAGRLFKALLPKAPAGLRFNNSPSSSHSNSSFSFSSSSAASSLSSGRSSAAAAGVRHQRGIGRCFSCSGLAEDEDEDEEDDDFDEKGRRRRSLSGGGWNDSVGRMRNVLFGGGGGVSRR